MNPNIKLVKPEREEKFTKEELDEMIQDGDLLHSMRDVLTVEKEIRDFAVKIGQENAAEVSRMKINTFNAVIQVLEYMGGNHENSQVQQ